MNLQTLIIAINIVYGSKSRNSSLMSLRKSQSDIFESLTRRARNVILNVCMMDGRTCAVFVVSTRVDVLNLNQAHEYFIDDGFPGRWNK